MNDFLEAAKSSEDDSHGDRDDSSEERYEKVKKEEAGTVDKDPAKQRYQEIKEKAKKELMREKEQEKEEESEEKSDESEDINYSGEEAFDDEESDKERFVTY